MGIMAMDAEQVGPLAPCKITGPLPVYPRPPVPVEITVTLSAEQIALGEID